MTGDIETRSETICIRLTPTEESELREAAGFYAENLSDFGRRALMDRIEQTLVLKLRTNRRADSPARSAEE